jgi:hypothetical protein
MSNDDLKLRGRMRRMVYSAEGSLVTQRESTNIVLRQGASIVAQLVAGKPGSEPINQIQVGFGSDVGDAEATSLAPPDDPTILIDALRIPVTHSDFNIQTDRPSVVQMHIATLFQPAVELLNVTEAGLLAGEFLYNRVVFEPVTLRVNQHVTFFWEIDFPFGA